MPDEATEALYLPAAQQALLSFPIDAAAIVLVSVSENVTYRVTDCSNADWVLRLHRPGYHTLDELISERFWIRALRTAGINVPDTLRTLDGNEYARVTIPATAEQRYAGVARWTEGELLMDRLRSAPDTDLLTHYYQQLGGIMAAMHTQACAWPLPASFARHRLNADGLMGPAPFWGPFWSHPALSAGERQLLIGTRDQMHGILTRYGEQSDTWSLIHADLHPGNLLLQDDELTVIDFDDAGFGWHQYDIAVALVHYETHPHYAAIEQALLQGYRRQRPLSPAAEAMIPVFRLIRHMVSIGWLYQRPELGRPLSPRYKDAVCAACRAFKG